MPDIRMCAIASQPAQCAIEPNYHGHSGVDSTYGECRTITEDARRIGEQL